MSPGLSGLGHLMEKQDLTRYFKDIVDAVKDGIMMVDTDGRIVMVNAAMARMTGFAENEMIGSPCTILDCDACDQLRSDTEEKWCRLFVRNQVRNKRCTMTKKSGAYLNAVKEAFVLKDEHGKVVGALETYTDTTELDRKDAKIRELLRLLNTESGFHGMVGHSQSMQNIYQLIEKIARSDSTVLISGESGTGKELVADAIHELGKRNKGPFVKINCAALNELLIENELFGHRKGAFTGAYRHRKGLFETANNGDIFLDEIGEIPLPTQAKLLRVLETKQFTRIGGSRAINVDTRIITATNRNLAERVSRGLFREDLFYRINIFPVHLPPLRDRKNDIALLVKAFVHELRSDSQKRITGVNPEVMDIFMHYHWPGNIRELRSALEYAFLVAESGLVEIHHLPSQLQSALKPTTAPQGVSADSSAAVGLEEKAQLIEALQKAGGNQSRAAGILGVHRMTVFNRMRKYGITLKNNI
jgi:two-component system, NtrC family, response regulator HydG